MAQRVLKQLEMRDTVLSDRDELTVDHGVARHARQRFGDLDIAAADDLAVAAVESATLPRRISAIIRKPSYLSSKTQPGSSNGASVSVASIGRRRLGRVDVRLIRGQSLERVAKCMDVLQG